MRTVTFKKKKIRIYCVIKDEDMLQVAYAKKRIQQNGKIVDDDARYIIDDPQLDVKRLRVLNYDTNESFLLTGFLALTEAGKMKITATEILKRKPN